MASFSPMFHWTERKIHLHVFYCALALHIAHLMRRHTAHAELDLSVRRLLASLAGIQETVLLYQAERGRPRAPRMLTDRELPNNGCSTCSTSTAGHPTANPPRG